MDGGWTCRGRGKCCMVVVSIVVSGAVRDRAQAAETGRAIRLVVAAFAFPHDGRVTTIRFRRIVGLLSGIGGAVRHAGYVGVHDLRRRIAVER